MKKLLIISILLLSSSVVYAQAKPCCKNKAKTGISCKNSQVNTETALNSEELPSTDQLSAKPCSSSKTCCKKEGKSSWWKFCAKKSNQACCNTSETTDAIDNKGINNNIKGKVFVPAYTDHSTGCNSY